MFSFRTTHIEDQLDRALNDGKVGVFCTDNCWDPNRGAYLYDIFSRRGNLKELFLPEQSAAGIAPHISFSKERLEGLNAVVVEIQDVGSRYFNYTNDVFSLMDSLNEIQDAPSLYIIDHLNPAGRVVEGSMQAGVTVTGAPKMAHKHGMTLGELAHLYHNESDFSYALHIVSAMASGASRLLPWAIPPASEFGGMFSCQLYSGGGLWEHTTMCEGIGTGRAFEFIGAPYIKPNDQAPTAEGILMRSCSFTPLYGKYANKQCFGYQILVTPDQQYHSFLHTVRLMRHFKERYSEFEFTDGFFQRLADPVVGAYLKGEITYDIVQEHVKAEEQKWVRKAKRYVLYNDAPYRIK